MARLKFRFTPLHTVDFDVCSEPPPSEVPKPPDPAAEPDHPADPLKPAPAEG